MSMTGAHFVLLFLNLSMSSTIVSVGVEGYPVFGQGDEPSTASNETMGSELNSTSKPLENAGNAVNNLTRGNLDPVLNQLFSAREELLRDNRLSSLNAINNAGEELFKLNMSLAESKAIDLDLTRLHRQIEYTRAYILNYNNTAAINALNGADTQFIIIAQKLPQ